MSDIENPVIVERFDGIMTIVLNRPEKLNAITLGMAQAIASALDELDGDPALSVGIITARGPRFCAGADVDGFLKEGVPRAGGRGSAGIAQRPSTKPLIAAIEGLAIGGGFEIALSCDLIVAAEGAKFGLPEVKMGLAAAGGGLLYLSRLPAQIALELNLVGDPIPAERLHELGLINRVVPAGQALAAAQALARKIAQNAPLAVAAAKAVIRQCPTWGEDERWERQAAITDAVTSSADAQEGFRSFKEKRKPVWAGK